MPYAIRSTWNGSDFQNSLGKGGRDFPGPWGTSTSRNITSSKTKGIGDWSDADIKRAITQGVRKDGSRLEPPMGYPYYAKMTDGDLDAMVAYLRRCRRRSDAPLHGDAKAHLRQRGSLPMTS